MPQSERADIGDRDVYIVTGSISQTVNVCTPSEKRGQYEWTVRLTPQHFTTKTEVERFTDVDSLIGWLTNELLGQIEQRPMDTGTETLPQINEPVLETPPIGLEDAVWIERAMHITEVCIDELVREFLELPYLHRVEHIQVALPERTRHSGLRPHRPVPGHLVPYFQCDSQVHSFQAR